MGWHSQQPLQYYNDDHDEIQEKNILLLLFLYVKKNIHANVYGREKQNLNVIVEVLIIFFKEHL